MMSLKPMKRTAIFTALASAAALSPVGGYASEYALEEVVVTAQKREQGLQDIPSSVSALNGEMLENSNTTDFSDLGKLAAGIAVGGPQDGTRPGIRIRGVGTNPSQPSIRPSVGIFIDEVPLVQPGSAFSNMGDIERVEILKGPQSTLFGKEVSSGAISLYTARPHTDEIEGFGEIVVGNNGKQEYRAGINLPLTETLAMRISAYDTTSEGEVKDVQTGDRSERDNQGARFRLLWQPNDSFNTTLSYENSVNDLKGQETERLFWGNISESLADRPEYGGNNNGVADDLLPTDPFDNKIQTNNSVIRNTGFDLWSLRTDWQINNEWSFNSVTGYQEYTVRRHKNTNGTGQDCSPGPVDICRAFEDRETEALSQELRFVYENDKLASVFGVFLGWNNHGDETDTFIYIASDLPFDLDGNPTTPTDIRAAGRNGNAEDLEDRAIFSHNTYSFSEDLDLVFGLRYSEVEKTSTHFTKTGQGVYYDPADLDQLLVPVSTWDAPEQHRVWDALTGTVKLNYRINEDTSVYAGIDRGFKAGGFNVSKNGAADGTLVVTEDPFDEEIAHNFEAGIKSTALDGTMRWNVAVFYQIYDDYQVETQAGSTIGVRMLNADKVISQGIEADFMWRLDEHWLLDGNIAYVDARFDEYENASCVLNSNTACGPDRVLDLSGKRLNGTSPWSANLNATYNGILDNGMNWFARGELAFKDDVLHLTDLDPLSRSGSYTLVNASVGISSEDEVWNLSLWGKNLTDEEYHTQFLRGRDGDVKEGLLSWNGAGRTYGIKLSYKF